MGDWQPLMARDGHTFNAWLAAPPSKPRSAVVILQEIFGVTEHIRAVTDRYAAAGYVAIAPSLYDRIGSRISTGYSPEDLQRARGYMLQVKREDALRDIASSINVVRHAGRVALIGYCWGGTLAWIGARTLPIHAAVGYYVSRIGEHLDGVPNCPMMFHFGEHDANIPLADVDKARALFPQGQFHIYPAGHGFNCEARSSYDAASATLAWQRTQQFLAEHLRGAPAVTHADED
jgi:carboxymethylenebutenolidase